MHVWDSSKALALYLISFVLYGRSLGWGSSQWWITHFAIMFIIRCPQISSGESSLAANCGLFNDSLFSLSCHCFFCFASLSHSLHCSQDLNWYPVSKIFLHFDCKHCLVGCSWDFSSMWSVPEYVAKDCLMLRYDTTCILSICTMTINEMTQRYTYTLSRFIILCG